MVLVTEMVLEKKRGWGLFFFSKTQKSALGPQIGQCVGIDISEAMVEQYNARTKRDVRGFPTLESDRLLRIYI